MRDRVVIDRQSTFAPLHSRGIFLYACAQKPYLTLRQTNRIFSPFTHKNPQGLLDNFAGKGQPVGKGQRGQPGFKERVDFGEVIGEVNGRIVTVDGQIAPSTSASKPRMRLSPHEAPQ